MSAYPLWYLRSSWRSSMLSKKLVKVGPKLGQSSTPDLTDMPLEFRSQRYHNVCARLSPTQIYLQIFCGIDTF